MTEMIENRTTISWEDKAWLESFPLNAFTVLDYFSHSQFYDKTCINEFVKMQRGLSAAEMEATMAKMTGFEYVLHAAHEVKASGHNPAHSLYVILRQRRAVKPKGPPELTPVCYYYVLDGVAYEVPSVQEVLKERLMRIGWLLDGAFDAITDGVNTPHSSEGGSCMTDAVDKRHREVKRKRAAIEHA
eukprot:CAMPEP_0119374920 /NCGR_PEP_ID=MMETSP1334-20130426/33421_1 /TAXON_ID=127549 /ORGANISM="Calcidiscus leptoporus, Strain RCC1130" /LENGTH=186 /DNA_ID=CAMNT_0007393119 /DNA_START=51 /DNA_END=611 /DNA_ORIENTATION=-